MSDTDDSATAPAVPRGGTSSRRASSATSKGQARRREIVAAAAQILREAGPAGVTHRSVARRAGCSLSAMTYYFDGLEQLQAEAGAINISQWAERAERITDGVEAYVGDIPRIRAIEAVVAAMDPQGEEPLLGHYLQLVAAGGSEPVRLAYHAGRGRLNAAMERILRRIGSSCSPDLVIAIIDGAAVTSISEGVSLRSFAISLLDEVL